MLFSDSCENHKKQCNKEERYELYRAVLLLQKYQCSLTGGE